mmetsp:Transcript_20256/g.61478  ORF Transcript_20256/g.61478 Transcript_20256/m.61478 type:complete len:232 (+) Transcript_20256:3065-3760(+)
MPSSSDTAALAKASRSSGHSAAPPSSPTSPSPGLRPPLGSMSSSRKQAISRPAVTVRMGRCSAARSERAMLLMPVLGPGTATRSSLMTMRRSDADRPALKPAPSPRVRSRPTRRCTRPKSSEQRRRSCTCSCRSFASSVGASSTCPSLLPTLAFDPLEVERPRSRGGLGASSGSPAAASIEPAALVPVRTLVNMFTTSLRKSTVCSSDVACAKATSPAPPRRQCRKPSLLA